MKMWLVLIMFCLLIQVLLMMLTAKAIEENEVCRVVQNTVRHKYKENEREILFPTSGKFVVESHYATNELSEFPDSSIEGMESHLSRSCALLERADIKCPSYSNSWEHVWTPSESGKIGQGARGASQLVGLNAWDEMWMGTQMWAKGYIPKPGTKYLLHANNKFVVVQFGWETGPSGFKYLGGLTVEVHKYLGTTSSSVIDIGLLKNQNILTGPINCD